MTDEPRRPAYLFERMARALLACPAALLGAINGAAYRRRAASSRCCCDFAYAAE